MKSLLEKFSSLRVLVIGDVMLDEYVFGDVHRISPEAPVPVLAVESDKHTLGGAANVAENLVALGAHAELCGRTGADAAGERLREELKKSAIVYDRRFVGRHCHTIVKTRVVARRQQLCRLDREGAPSDYALTAKPLRELLLAKIKTADAVIFSDYAKGALDTALVTEMLAKSKGKFRAFDPKPRNLIEARGFDLITPNRAEALELAGFHAEAHVAAPTWEVVCKKIHEKYQPKYLVVTLGAEGMLLSAQGRAPQKIPTYAREVFDVSGAGDTVIAALTLALAAGASLPDAAHLANTAAGVVVGKFGTATATPEEILNYHPQ